MLITLFGQCFKTNTDNFLYSMKPTTYATYLVVKRETFARLKFLGFVIAVPDAPSVLEKVSPIQSDH